ncbi:MAG: hypothetical protein ACQESF_00030 [Nanobdellota archaeon]
MLEINQNETDEVLSANTYKKICLDKSSNKTHPVAHETQESSSLEFSTFRAISKKFALGRYSSFFTTANNLPYIIDADSEVLDNKGDGLNFVENKLEEQDENCKGRLEELVKNEQLNLNLILSIPRAGSTILRHVVGTSSSISSSVHEPFIDYGYRSGRIEEGYNAIFEKYYHEKNSSKVNLLIKEMGHFITRNGAYDNIFDLVNSPVILNVRHPYLAAESRIRKVLETTPDKARINTQNWLFDYAERFCNIGSKINAEPTPDVFCFDYRKEWLSEGKRLADKEVQQKLLDFYSKTKGYGSWNEMFDYALENHDYRSFTDLLESLQDKRFHESGFGWQAMGEILDYVKVNDIDAIVIDNTDFREQPENFVKEISKRTGLEFDCRMLYWEKGCVDTGNQTREHEKKWYDQVNNSCRVEPEKNYFPERIRFPDFVQRYLDKTAMPVYRKFLKSSNRLLNSN